MKTTRAGTKMMMVQRDIPQSVSVVSEQRMQDQKLQTLGDVLSNTTGISASVADSDRISYYSRGFLIDNYMVDGIPTFYETRWNLGDSLSDTALLRTGRNRARRHRFNDRAGQPLRCGQYGA
ncbi:ferric-rhodotorulic acid outer membrane transporter [Atlantibacter hermannii]|nr:ferric-rhodotorulic acid outer membrane transporter [Atlantibacter hermannii]